MRKRYLLEILEHEFVIISVTVALMGHLLINIFVWELAGSY